MTYVRVGEIVEHAGAQYQCVGDDIIPVFDCAQMCAFNGLNACILYECRRYNRPDNVNVHFVRVEGKV